MGCSPWCREESDTTEQLPFHFSLSCIGEGNGNPLQCSCLENLRDGGAWWAAVYGVTQSQTRLKRLSSSSSSTGSSSSIIYYLKCLSPLNLGVRSSTSHSLKPAPCVICTQPLCFIPTKHYSHKNVVNARDFPGSPVVKNPPCNAGNAGVIPGQGTKIPHAVEQLNTHAVTTECVPQWKSLHDATKIPCASTRTRCGQKNKY